MSGIPHAKCPGRNQCLLAYVMSIIKQSRNYLHRHDASYCREIRQSHQIIEVSSGLVHVICFYFTVRRLRHHYAIYSAPAASTRFHTWQFSREKLEEESLTAAFACDNYDRTNVYQATTRESWLSRRSINRNGSRGSNLLRFQTTR